MENNYNYNEPVEESTHEPNFVMHTEPEKKHKKSRRSNAHMKKWISAFCAAILLGSVAGGSFVAVSYIGVQTLGLDSQVVGEETTEEVAEVATVQTSTTNITSDIATIAEDTLPCIVSITSMTVAQVQDFFGNVSEQESSGAGSGIIVGQTDEELLVLTNNHVVEGSTTLTITFSNEESVEASIKGTDSEKDLAIVSVAIEDITDIMWEGIEIATLGDSDEMQVGETVIAIGNALGYGQSVTVGVLSATDRVIDGIDASLLQTDAAINPGNSGGALLNAAGEVIGINTAKASDTSVEGMGYAIPISEAMDTIEALMNQETLEIVPEEDRGMIGITGTSLTEETAEMYNMPTGVYIREITEGGAADEAGIVAGSVITELNGISVTDMDDLLDKMQYYAAGEVITLTIEKPSQAGGYEEMTVEVTLQAAQ